MLGFLLNRIAQSAVVLLVMSFVIYALIGLMPGDPVDLMITADPKITAADAAHLRELYGVDKPITERYGNWLSAALSGDFGFSRLHAKPVLDVLLPALGHTVTLLGLSLALALAIALPMGILAAVRAHTKLDYSINLLAFAGISVPPFWLALIIDPRVCSNLGRSAGRRVRCRGRRTRSVGEPQISCSARGQPDHRIHRWPYPLYARRNAGDIAPRLHPHRLRQRIWHFARGSRTCTPQRDDPCRDDHRIGFRLFVLRRPDYRNHFQFPRDGQIDF